MISSEKKFQKRSSTLPNAFKYVRKFWNKKIEPIERIRSISIIHPPPSELERQSWIFSIRSKFNWTGLFNLRFVNSLCVFTLWPPKLVQQILLPKNKNKNLFVETGSTQIGPELLVIVLAR